MSIESDSAPPCAATRRTIVVDGPLAFHARRHAAAKAGASGLQIFALPHLAARLAGGFQHRARSQDLDAAIRAALDAGGFEEIEDVRGLPGMTRAISRALTKLWHADIDLAESAKSQGRMRDLLEIERRVREALPQGALILRDLRDAALTRTSHTKRVLGDVEIDQRGDVAPLWRPLIAALACEVDVTWREPAITMSWFTGTVLKPPSRPSAIEPVRISCANPRSEVIEALRWMRERLAGGVAPQEIAICAASTEIWDEHFDALATEAALPLHFSHGRIALGTYDGQACAALADVLVQGLSQRRVRRIMWYVRENKALEGLPSNWTKGLQKDAALFSVLHWQSALDRAAALRQDGVDPRPIMMPV